MALYLIFMQDITLKDLLEAGCHFGHKADRWHPKATEFIYQERGGIHIIDLAKTRSGLLEAAEYIKQFTAEGKKVLFVGTKRQAAGILKEEATRVGAPYISRRWIGGLLTNWDQVHKNLQKIRQLAEEEKTGAWKPYPKHERVKLARYLGRLRQFYGGIELMTDPPSALFIVDVHREIVAVREGMKMGTPIIGVVDTNSDPTGITYVIPANDDAVGSLSIIIKYLAQAFLEGKEEFNNNTAKAAKIAEKKEIKKTLATEIKVEPKTLEVVPVNTPTPKVKPKTKKATTQTAVKPEVVVEKPKKRGRPKKTA